MVGTSTIRMPLFERVLNAACPALVAAAIFWISYDGGSYSPSDRGTIAVAVWWALLLGVILGLWPVARVPRLALAAGALLAGFALLSGLSAIWAESAEKAVAELNRVLLYLGIIVLAAVALPGRRVGACVAGVGTGIAAVGVLALAARLFPGEFPANRELAQLFPAAEKRLAYPVGYWNGLATLIALGIPAILSTAATAGHLILRAAALAPLPALAATVYLTSSRGGTAAAFMAVTAFLLLSGSWAAAGAAAAGALGVTGALAVVVTRPELVDGPLSSAAAESQGRSAALLILAICLVTSLLYAVGVRLFHEPPPAPRVVKLAAAATAVVALAGGVAAADPVERFESFRRNPPELAHASVQEHLFSGSGNGRWQLWEVGYEQFADQPEVGQGAGSYEAWWAREGTLRLFVRDAHSLYVETAGELGLAGLVLLLGFLGLVLAAGFRRVFATAGAERASFAALTAIVLAYAFEAGFDWMWELTAVSVVMFFAAGLLLGAGDSARNLARAPALRAAATALALGLLVFQTMSLFGVQSIRQSEDAAAAGRLDDARSDALAARSLQPWAASPYLQLALIEEQRGQLAAARDAIEDAIERDRSDWRLWLVAARLETKAGLFEAARQSLERAERLNPRSPLFAD